MLIVSYKNIGEISLTKKYPEKIKLLEIGNESFTNSSLIEFIEEIKKSQNEYEIVITYYKQEIILCLDTLAIPYTIAYPTEMDKARIQDLNLYNTFKGLATKCDSIVLKVNETLENALETKFEWVKKDEPKKEIEDKKEENQIETKKENDEKNQEVQMVVQPQIDKNKLTLQELIEQDIDITEADIRELKSTTNKFKVALMLQAKSRLNTVLKLCNVLDKLYDELINRIDQSLTTTDTPSLMYTTEYISKALADTNQFIMSLITNEKIQNFFIIDNSNIININDNRVDIDKREKIRKAAEIVLDNADYFANGEYDKVIDPNTVFDENEGDSDVNTTT